MGIETVACPSAELLVAWADGTLDPHDKSEALVHVAECDECREALSELADADTSPLGRVSTPGKADDYPRLVPIDADHYVIEREIARGGMGRILLARDRRLGRIVAIKELVASSSSVRGRFEREARITARLQHPAIVSVLEAGTWPTGEPFYAMPLVRGTSLSEAIASRPTLDDRLALLPHVIAAVDALAFAHDAGVIHRDLKPANVIVGNYGETAVIDWGLAKDLNAPGQPSEISEDSFPEASELTIAGSVVGTPAYMPPEQAAGAPLDERADVYALGAMLYHLMVGAPPYGGSVREVLDAVRVVPPRPIRQVVAGVPLDLAAIAEKAMARAAADRYPTARELAEDLKKFHTGQLVSAHHYSTRQLVRRWMRRRRVPVAISMVAIVLLACLGIVSVVRIEAQREAAEASRSGAEQLMSFMLQDLHAKLESVGKLDLLEVVARKANQYYSERDQRLTSGDQRKAVIAQRSLGDVLLAKGSTVAAMAAYRAAQALGERLVLAHPMAMDGAAEQELALVHWRLGDVWIRQGNPSAAIAAYRASKAIGENLLATDPNNAEVQYVLSVSNGRLADVLAREGNGPGALAAYRAAVAIGDKLVASHPDNPEWKAGTASLRDKMGLALQRQGDLSAALAAFRASLDMREQLAAADRENSGVQRELALSYKHVGTVLGLRGDAAAALAAHSKSKSIGEKLTATDPANGLWQYELALVNERVGDALLEQGDASSALAAFRAAAAIGEKLVATDPANTLRQRGLVVFRRRIAEVLTQQGDLDGALAASQTNLTTLDKLASEDATNTDLLRELAISYARVGDLHWMRDDLATALTMFRAGRGIREKLAAVDPDNREWQYAVSMSHDDIGKVLRSQGNAAEALGEYRAAAAIADKLVAGDPTSCKWQRGLVSYRDGIGDLLLAQGDAPAALALYRTNLTKLETLTSANPTHHVLASELAREHSRVGQALLAQGDAAAALVSFRTSQSMLEQLVAIDSTNVEYQHDLGKAHAGVADALLERHHESAALVAYRKALPILEQVRARAPKHRQWTDDTARVRTMARAAQAGGRRSLRPR